MRASKLAFLALLGCRTGATAPPVTSVAADAAKPDLEAVCPTKDVYGYTVHRGESAGANAGEAIAAARESATKGLLERACAGYGEVRCAATSRHVKPWKEGFYDPSGQWACASVSVAAADIESLAADAAVLDTQLRTLAAAVAERAGTKPIAVMAPTWASGCSSGTIGQALSGGLFNHLATHPAVRLVEPEAADGHQRLRMELAPGATGVTLSAFLQGTDGKLAPLPGFSFPLDLFVVDEGEDGTCRSDSSLGLAHGERLGAGGLRVRVELPGVDGVACEGGAVGPVVRVNRPARVQVFSIAKDGRSLLVWPPPGGDPLVQREVMLGDMFLVAQPESGDERLVAVAVPDGASLGRTDGWHGFCEVAGGVGPDLYPEDAAVSAATFTVLPSGAGECPAVAGVERLREQVVLPPACGQ